MNSNVELGHVISPYVDGMLLQSASEARVDSINPSNGKRIFQISKGSGIDVERAVTSARRAFDSGCWSDASPSFRKEALSRWADLVANEATDLDVLDATEMGKPIGEELFNARKAAGLLRFYAEALDKVAGDIYSSDSKAFVAQRWVPRGVVAAIIPWNFPTYNALLKAAPALAAGNSLVLKPSELSSSSAIRIAQLALQAGVPPGVFNLVPGLGETVGQAMGLHGDVDMLSFTGSTTVGKAMLQYAGQSNMKIVVAECGGKSPHIVFADGVDLDAVGESIARFMLANQGQICSVGSRLLVQRPIEAVLIEKITAHMRKAVIGDACDPKTTFGPLVSAKQCARVMGYIDSAASEGAQLVMGGRRILQGSGGFFVEPTVFRSVPPTARIAREEIFGPVLSVIPFENEAQAIEIANDTIYGLVAYLWTANLSMGMRVAKAIRSSVVINAAAPSGEGAGYAASFEPARQSGIGTEGGMAGLESYLRRQLLWFNHA